MSYVKDAGEVSARFRPVVEVPRLTMGGGTSVRLVAPGSVTNGQFGLFEWTMPPRAGGPGPHFHRTFSESFYVQSGVVRLYNGERWVDGAAGDFVYVPEGGVHAFRNDGDLEASMLILFAPGVARERYFQELVEVSASGRELSEGEWTELYARHDQYRAG
jgi:quercetin dioxygenase-like cupin family protein